MLGNRMSQHSFAQTPDIHIQRSSFDRSFAVKDTFDFDYLVPIMVDEILPGDTCNVTLNAFARLATQKVPIMDNMYIDYFFFFVPNRLVWNNWEKFNGAQDNPGDSTDYLVPRIGFTNLNPATGSLGDKFGLPTDVNVTSDPGKLTGWVNALPFRCYYEIWNNWFRDENLQNRVSVPKDDGPDTGANFSALLKRGKRHDYFTSALPWPQKGPAVQLPLGASAPIISNGAEPTLYNTSNPGGLRFANTSGTPQMYFEATPGGSSGTGWKWKNTGLQADLAGATAATINQLREAFAMQSLFELDAQGGTRYVEILQAHFNVVSPDFRLQRPEFLGGGSTRINSHPVANTSGTGTQANLAAFATASTQGTHIGFTKSFTEHGYVIGLACARADITYQQGINKMWLRRTRYDFYWPMLSQLGEQAITNKEIYYKGVAATDSAVFGYNERYAEYRYKPSEIHGKFRSTYSAPLDMWHLAEKFADTPALNSTFIQQSTPIERAIAVPSEPHILFDGWFQYKHARPMPVYSIPAKLGRF